MASFCLDARLQCRGPYGWNEHERRLSDAQAQRYRIQTEALRRLYAHPEPGGTLVLSLMLLWKQEPPAPRFTTEWSDWRRAVRASDGAIFRRRSRATFDMVQQVQSTEDEYELVRDGRVLAAAAYARSPATRWYSQAQARALLHDVGFSEVRLTSGFTHQPAELDDSLFCVLANRPATTRRQSAEDEPRCR